MNATPEIADKTRTEARSRATADQQADLPLRGNHAVVTGASRGIGFAIAARLAELGADVTLMARSEAALADNVARLRDNSRVRAQAVPIDLADESRVAAAFREAGQAFGAPTILVNNAGIAQAAPFSRTDPGLWQRLLDIDLTGPFLCIREVCDAMLKARYGRIVNIASTAGQTGYPYVAAYCAAKHGLIGLTRALAQEFARSGITVNAVCPGYTDTEIVGTALQQIVAKTGRTREHALAELVAHNPMRRLIAPREVAEAVGWLCLPSSASVNGQSIMIDGGELM